MNVEPGTGGPAETATAEIPPAQNRYVRVMRWIAYVAAGFVALLLTLWVVAALQFDVRAPWLRTPLAVAYVVAILAIWIRAKGLFRKLLLTFLAFGLVLGWWLSLRPSNDRDWQPDVAKLAYAEIEGNQVTLHNIRNCDYRTETDFDVRYYDKTLDLDQLRTADLYMVWWGAPYMAHTMMSFGFDGGQYVCFSIEARKEKKEAYSAIKGFFRQFELIHIVGDERDLVRLRTNYRKGEEAYLYRLRGSPEQLRKFFLDYVNGLNALRQQAQWYNAATDNCTTGIRALRAASDRAPWDWRMLVNGYGDKMLYERGIIDTNLPFAEFKEKCHINQRARAADKEADFSSQIRQGVPGTSL